MWVRITDNDIFEDNEWLRAFNEFNRLNPRQMKYVALYCERDRGPIRSYRRDEHEFKLRCAIVAGYATESKGIYSIDVDGLKMIAKLPKNMAIAIKLYRDHMVDIDAEIDLLDGLEQIRNELITALAKFKMPGPKSKVPPSAKLMLDVITRGTIKKTAEQIAQIKLLYENHYETEVYINTGRKVDEIQQKKIGAELDLSAADKR